MDNIPASRSSIMDQDVIAGYEYPSIRAIDNGDSITSRNGCTGCANLEFTEYAAKPWDDSKILSLNLPKVKDSADTGCQSCVLIISAVQASIVPTEITTKRELNDNQLRGVTDLHLLLHPDRVQPLRILLTYDGVQLDNEIYTNILYPNAPWSAISSEREVVACTKDALAQLKIWLAECESSHSDQCFSKMAPPTRLIDVGLDGTPPKLCGPKGTSEPYLALSHCWGKSALLRTMKANQKAHEESIPWDELSKTFQDSITCSRELGIRYLWIDSLCIIQDDALDWATESGRMGDVYFGAHLVLAATEASNGTVGFLTSRQLFLPGRTIFSGISNSGQEYRIQMRAWNQAREVHSWHSEGNRIECPLGRRAPLMKRAWCFQERLLARRIVHFNEQEMVFECQSSAKCECHYVELSAASASRNNPSFRQILKKGEFFDIWEIICSEYSGRTLTYHSDFLPALSGLVKQMQEFGAGDYLAGNWRNWLLLNIIWYTNAPRALSFTAPTWSWASLDFAGHENRFVSFSRLDTMKTRYDPKSFNTVAILVEATCEPLTTDPTGAIKSGYLIVKGPLLPILVRGPADEQAKSIHTAYTKTPNADQHEIKVSLDPELVTKTAAGSKVLDLSLLHIGSKIDGYNDAGFTPKGLVVQKIRRGEPYDVYERVGAFLYYNYQKEFVFKDAPVTTIMIL